MRYFTAGESHGPALVAIIEGLPAGLAVDTNYINKQLYRRQKGYGRGHRQKIEADQVQILSGIRHGRCLGSPVTLLIENLDHKNWQDVMSAKPTSFSDDKQVRRLKRPRPGHADLAGGLKYQTRDLRDILERASARETAARVAAGALARLLLAEFKIEIASHVVMLGGVPEAPIEADWDSIVAIQDDELLRCVDPQVTQKMIERIDAARTAGDTLGGIFEVVARGLPAGLGSHTQWDLRLDGLLAQAVMSIQAVKAVEIGRGIVAAYLPGSQIHDEIGYNAKDKSFTRRTNRAGGLEGGITNGQELRIRGYLKPISTLRRPLQSVDIDTKDVSIAAFERSDITAVPAAGVIAEAAVALTLAAAFKTKFGGDSLEEMKANYNSYLEMLKNF
ncbi:MAG: chorismate synthase [Blastocatellia bacterium]|nr:chorismate synthase [Blastocatellia bacterium]